MSKRTIAAIVVGAVILGAIIYLWTRSRRDAVASTSPVPPSEGADGERSETERLVATGGAGLATFASALAGAVA